MFLIIRVLNIVELTPLFPPSRQTSNGSVLFGYKILRKAPRLNFGCQVRRTATTARILVEISVFL